MKNTHKLIVLLLVFLLVSCNSTKTQSIKITKTNEETLEDQFRTPPATTQTSVYWYWISDHISAEGVVKDLQSMKKAGINRAFIGNIGLAEDVFKGGKVKFGTEEWWNVLHTALKTATELNIEIGIFNSPGWSQSGGPWVKSNQSMRYLASTSTEVKGGQKIDQSLAKPAGDFEDVRVIAYPIFKTKRIVLTPQNTSVTSYPPVLSDISKLIDGDMNTEILLQANNDREVIIDFAANISFPLRSLKIYPTHNGINNPAKIQVKENGIYRTLSEFNIDRHNSQLNVGFDPYAPIVISLPATTGSEFRLIVSNISSVGFKDIELSSVPTIERYPEKTFAKMFQSPLPYWNEYQWRMQETTEDESLVVNPNQVKDISAYLVGDRLVWDAPQGEWAIMRTGMLPTGTTNGPASPEATGLEIDKMSREHVEAHFDSFMGEVIRRIPAADRKTWKVIVQDSYETGGQNFTDNLISIFQKRYGYSPIPFLPVFNGVVVQNEDVSNRFLWDVRRLVADKVSYDYVAGLRDIGHKNGLTTWLECYGHWGYPGEFLQYGGQSDEIGGEFWAEGSLGDIENRAASSCGHIYGKTKISAESFTSAGNDFGRYPATLKQRGDLFFSEGINNTLLHVYIHQPYEDKEPGMNAWFGTEFNRKNTWFSQIDLFTDYLKRVNLMLQQGINVADVAYFIGEDAPKMTGITDPSLPKGYQFDYINAEVIEKNLFVRDGLLTLPHGTQYKMLVLPKLETMRPELLLKIKQLIENGAIVLGPAPKHSPSFEGYPQSDKKIQKIAGAMWATIDGVNTKYKKIGKGMLINGMNMQEAMALVSCVPDCKLANDAPVLYGHRKLGGKEIYFLTNQSNQILQVSPEFRVKEMQPEFWEPTFGISRNLPAYTQTSTGTIVPLKLEAYESAFIVFQNKATAASSTGVEKNFPESKILTKVTAPWSVQFDESKRGALMPMIMNQLEDISKNDKFDVKHYSGTMIYKSSFTLDKIVNNTFINLNEVYVMAKVKINNQYVGGVWTSPYRLNISKYIKKGTNTVEVEVVNTWVNRLIGDKKLPENERKASVLINSWNADSQLQKSGLLGPVVIENIPY